MIAIAPGTVWFALDAAAAGLCVGSFLNLACHRIPIMLSPSGPPFRAFNLGRPRSHCPHCDTPIKARHIIPVVSYLWLRGRCAACRCRISPAYCATEALCGLLWGLCAFSLGLCSTLAVSLFVSTLVAIGLRSFVP